MSGSDGSNGDAVSAGRVRELCIDRAVQKELERIPEKIRDRFLVSLEMIRCGVEPALAHQKLKGAAAGASELKINGSPAFRCMYAVHKNGDVIVLHVTEKTAQGQDKQLIQTTAARMKRLMPR